MKPLEHGESRPYPRPRRSPSTWSPLPAANSHACRIAAEWNELERADKTGAGRRTKRRQEIRLTLLGELDIQRLPELWEGLRNALDSGSEVVVDLSGITFLDTLCLRELVVHCQLHSRLHLWRPSREVKLSVAICGLEEWVSFRTGREAAYRPPARTGAVPTADEPEDGLGGDPAGRKPRPSRARRLPQELAHEDKTDETPGPNPTE